MDVSLDLKKKIVFWQKELYLLAELGWQEKKTSAYIEKELGAPVWKKKTGLIYSVGTGRVVFFRAELDGLPTETGVKHVCGHHIHMAALMGAFLYFKKNPVAGVKILFLFQPAEESYPSGAAFIEDEYLKKFKVALGFGFHVFPSSQMGVLFNPIFASADYFQIRLFGHGTHIKNKYSTELDVVTEAARLAVKINQKRIRAGIINVGVLRAGEVANRIGAEAYLAGDIRSLSDASGKKLRQYLEDLLAEIRARGVKIEYYFNQGYPLLKNENRIVRRMAEVLAIDSKVSSFAAEDFSLYRAKTLFLLVGSGNLSELHETDFIVDDRVGGMIFEYWCRIGRILPDLLVSN